jgi:hypothetical protein
MQLALIVLTKRKETVTKDLDKHFYRSNVSQCTCRKRINHSDHGLLTNISLVGFSLTSSYVNINNKIILINRKEAYTSPNSSTKIINNKISP